MQDIDVGWYRVRFTLSDAPDALHGIFVRYRRAQEVALFVNGVRIGGSRESNAEVAGRVGAGREASINLTVPPSVLRAGENVIDVRMRGSSHSAQIHGLGRVHFGDARSIRKAYVEFAEWGFNAKRDAIVLALATGVITLFVWFARRADRVILWFSVACLSWGSVGYAYVKLRWSLPETMTSALFFYVTYGLIVPTLVVALRVARRHWPIAEAALWLLFIVQMSYPFWPGEAWPGAFLAWDALNAVLLLVAGVIVWQAASKPRAWTTKLQLMALGAMSAVIGHEIARHLGWVDIETPVLRHYHVPVMLVAMGLVCVDRYVRALRRIDRSNVELARRIAETTAELDRKHAETEELIRERTFSEERQRVISDMHDRLGSQLVGLLRHVQSGVATIPSLRQRAREALGAMRMAVAALQPRSADLTAVVGSLRQRMDALVVGSGLRLSWQVDELPDIGVLGPQAVYALNGIVLESVGNVLKHAHASEVRFIARATAEGGVELRIEDDGQGFDPTLGHDGLGLSSMRKRAASMDARFEVASAPGAGAVVTLRWHVSDPHTSKLGAMSTASGNPSALGWGGWLLLSIVFAGQQDAAIAAAPVLVIERAEFVVDAAPRPPVDGPAWQNVLLPDQWRERGIATGAGWYRMRFDLASKPSSQYALMVRARRSHQMAFYVNGMLAGTAWDNQSMADRFVGRGFGSPVRHYVLPGMLRAGTNVIHVRMEASGEPSMMHGLGRVYFGEARAVRGVYNEFNELGFSARRDAISVALAAGLVALLLWLARRGDRVMFWFAASCLSWGIVGHVYLLLRWYDGPLLVSWFYFHSAYGLVVPTLILALRTANQRWPIVETALWVYFAVGLSFPVWADGRAHVLLLFDALNALLLLGAVVVVALHAGGRRNWPVQVQIGALVAMAAAMGAELARYFGVFDVETAEWRHYHVPVMLLAMGAVTFDRHLRAAREAERSAATLEQRFAAKVGEIEAQHALAEGAMKARTLAEERQRILSELNDGLGASLIMTLKSLDANECDLGSIERRVKWLLAQLRIAIDALRPNEGGLTAVLAGLRYRLAETITAHGLRLVWAVGDLQDGPALSPTVVFDVQRILIEAVENVFEHAHARTLWVNVHCSDSGVVEVAVADDGVGFDPRTLTEGSGLTRMRRRAVRHGWRVGMASVRSGGTRLTLDLPAYGGTDGP